jgi:hypothetical protein
MATSRPMSTRATSTTSAGHAIAQRQPRATAIAALKTGPASDGTSQMSAYMPSTRVRSASS